ncbi:IS5/IS1182 family transposase, partial [Acinetobacter baumannii]|nr:IS5/IS1182 family transposase [Acinetobacter baumannii]
MNKPASKIYRTPNWSSYTRPLINRGHLSFLLYP